MNKELLWLWGKTVKNKDGQQSTDEYHPVLFHLLDVAYVAQLLWDEALPARTKNQIACALNLDNDTARRLVVLVAAAHDLGKVAPGFQFQKGDPEFGPQFLWERLRSGGLDSTSETKNTLHSFISAKVLKPLWSSEETTLRTSASSAKVLAHITGAHHGRFPRSSDLDYGTNVLGDEAWERARRELWVMVETTLFGADAEPISCDDISNAALVPIIAGLISVADWIGSSEYFRAAASRQTMPAIADYAILSQSSAREALEKFGWLPSVQIAAVRDFAQVFDFQPNALQDKMMAASEKMDGPFLAIVESEMGSGKTEAALWAADAALCRDLARGFYLALPTQATSNALHTRLSEGYFARRGHTLNVALQLAHGNALLHSAPEKESAQSDDTELVNGADAAPILAASTWFDGRKRPLLAPFGVGTIDQSLMGALQTSHWFVRLFALTGKVVIFDEIHAYDTYMSTLLERLLQWLRVLDCSVILLSATLPKSKRHRLLKAWGAQLSTPEKPYPRLTWADERGADSHAIYDDNDIRRAIKTVSIEVAKNDVATLATTLRAALSGEDGGCAAVICNTVDRAQELFGVLRHELKDVIPDDEFHLLHARMPFAWRKEREEIVLQKFGKNKASRPRRALVVGTQVMEQSLDFDFDWMASEMAPIDLLIQRLGRLHRHEKNEKGELIVRPQVLAAPKFTVLCDAALGTPPPYFGPYEGAVYERYILLCSWLALSAIEHIEIPGASDAPNGIETLINRVYDEEVEDVDENWRVELEKAKIIAENEHLKDEADAQKVMVSPPKPPKFLVEKFSAGLLENDDPNVHQTLRAATRSGSPSVTVVCLFQTERGLFLLDEQGAINYALPVDLQRKPPLSQTRELLRFAVPISKRALFNELKKEKAPVGWQKNAHLRFARALIFRNGHAYCAGYKLRLDRDLGLVIEKEKAGD